MKLTELLEITGLGQTAPFIVYEYGDGEKDTLTIKKNGIYFWQEATIDSFGNFDSNEHKSEISRFIESYVYANISQQPIYYAVCSVLYNIATIKGIAVEGYISSNLKVNVDRILQGIKANLDFAQVSKMGTLINKIAEDKLYQQLLFNVTERRFQKKMFGVYANQNPIKYSFGNIKYYEELKIVDITVYDDCVKLTYQFTGKSFERQFESSREVFTLEEKILAALDNWRCQYD